MRFTLGRLLLTRGAALVLSPTQATGLIHRHASGDWGDLGEEDKGTNEWAIANGARILSRYDVDGESFYVVTEADRSATTVLLRSEY